MGQNLAEFFSWTNLFEFFSCEFFRKRTKKKPVVAALMNQSKETRCLRKYGRKTNAFGLEEKLSERC